MKRYTVNQVARLSRVTVRTLHFYDEIGLLKPAHYGENGYRYYENEQLLFLQQIMFYRELGVPLEQIKTMLTSPDFDRLEALRAHRSRLEGEVERYGRLIRTIDDSIDELNGAWTMANDRRFEGFSPEKQRQYEQQLVDRYGDDVKAKIAGSRQRIKGWTKADFESSHGAWTDFLAALGSLAQEGHAADSAKVQVLIPTHRKWLESYWTPVRASYIGLGQLYAGHPDFRKQFDAVHLGLADFCADAMRVYAERELSQ